MNDIDWRTCSKIPSVSRIVAAAMDIRAIRSILELSGVSYAKLFLASQRKIPGDKSGVWEAKRRDHHAQSTCY
ncbi:hypothetical protein TNCV_358451 [Trichonephila clavipes]|nr:hypothetical protein TNCV_358451 [Trichonephila clavipes]